METRLRIPKNWQDFERLCNRLWSDIWADPNAQLNGRSGHSQAGVDIFGQPAYKGFYAGIQCKDKDGRLGTELSSSELRSACKHAVKFYPPLEQFTVATTAPRDVSVQLEARVLCHGKVFPFDVFVWSWDDIEGELLSRPKVLNSCYPDLELASEDHARINMSFITHRDQCSAFFSRPDMQRRIPSGIREFLLSLCYEISDNAYLHGKASRFSISCDDTIVRLDDNGLPFNPLIGLAPEKVSTKSHVGSYVFDTFRQEYGDRVKIRYERVIDKASELNRLSLEFCAPTYTFESPPKEITVDITQAVGRGSAERLAASVPLSNGASELVLAINNAYNISALVEFLRCLLTRLDQETRLAVYLPRHRLFERLERLFSDNRLSFRLR